MALPTVLEIQNRVNDQRRDATDGTIDDNKFFRALTAILQIIASRANFKFAIRKTTFQYLNGYPTYNIENILSLTDFKDIKDIRPQNDEDYDGRPFETIEADEFAQLVAAGSTRNVACVEWEDGEAANLKINPQNDTNPATVIHALDDLTSDGTLAADTTDSDAADLDTDDLELGGTSIKFSITVAQSANNKATIHIPTTAMSAKDLTDFLNAGKIRLLAFIPATLATHITSFELRIGSSSSAYYSQTVTVPADGIDFVTGKNEIEFGSPWTATGSPDIAAIDYLLITINYAAAMTNTTGVRLRKLEVVYPERLDLFYYSNFLVLDNDATTRKVDMDNAADKILIPHRHMEAVVEGVLWQVMDQMGNDADAEKHRQLFEYGPEYDTSKAAKRRWGGMQLMVRELGTSPVVEKRRFRIKRRAGLV